MSTRSPRATPSAATISAAATRAGVTVTTGDIALVRTGNMKLLRSGDKAARRNTPGLGVGSIEWLHDHELAAVATDTLCSRCGRRGPLGPCCPSTC